MLSRSRSNEQDETNGSGELQQRMSKKRDTGKKRTQSPKVNRSLRKKIQKFLQGSGENTAYDSHHSPVEIEDDMFICGIKRDPCTHECSLSTQRSFESHTKTSKNSFIEQGRRNSDGNITIPCIMGMNGPALEPTDQAEDSGCVDGRGAMDNKPSRIKDRDKNSGGGSSTIVEHILKELQGINKIQEEISDLRQYLTSVSGSVDEVSCCVDAVLLEIEELYSVGAVGHPSPRRVVAHQRSPGRQNVVAVPQSRNNSPIVKHRKLEKNEGRPLTARPNMSGWDVETDYRDVPRRAKLRNPKISDNLNAPSSRFKKSSYCHLERVYGQEFTSTSSLSSGHSSNSRDPDGSYQSREVDQHNSGWRRSEMQLSASGEGGWSGDTGWSEEDYCSCQNSADELETVGHPDTWYRYNGGETSSTPCHSSRSSSEHLSLLFGNHNDSPSSSSSVVDFRHPKNQTVGDIGCDCTSNCMYSRSSGYHTMDAYADESCSGPSRSLSCSTVGMTDYDDGCQNLHSSCEHCLCDMDSEKEWPGEVCPSVSEDQYDPDYSETTDTEESQPPNLGYDVVKINKAMITFHSALRGALTKLDMPEPQCLDEDTKSVVSSPCKSNDPEEESTGESNVDTVVPSNCATLDLSVFPHKSIEASSHGKDLLELLNQQRNSQAFDPLVSTPSTISPSHTPTEYYAVDHSDTVEETLTDHKLSSLQCIPELSPKHAGLSSGIVESYDHQMAFGTGNTEISPEGTNSGTLETDVNSKQAEHRLDNEHALEDPHHQKCLANIERVLKEKRHRHRLSRIANASKNTFSEEEFKQGTFFGSELKKLSLFLLVNNVIKINKIVLLSFCESSLILTLSTVLFFFSLLSCSVLQREAGKMIRSRLCFGQFLVIISFFINASLFKLFFVFHP